MLVIAQDAEMRMLFASELAERFTCHRVIAPSCIEKIEKVLVSQAVEMDNERRRRRVT